jgi:hypothetical protein
MHIVLHQALFFTVIDIKLLLYLKKQSFAKNDKNCCMQRYRYILMRAKRIQMDLAQLQNLYQAAQLNTKILNITVFEINVYKKSYFR